MRSPASRVLDALASTRWAVGLGLAAAALLATSSAFVPDPRGKDPLPFSESFDAFFPMQPQFWWFYALFAVLTLYTLNAAASILRAALRRRVWDLRFWGVTLMHLGAIGALLSHVAAGLTAGVEGSAILGSTPVEVRGRTLRLASYETILNPDGTLRTAIASVEVDGRPRRLAYNQPLWFDQGRRTALLQGERETMGAPRLSFTGRSVDAPVGSRVETPLGPVEVLGISQHESLRAPMVRMSVAGGPGRWVAPGTPLGAGVALDRFGSETGVLVVLRRNDGAPPLFASMIVFSGGMGLFLWGRRQRS